MSKATARWVSLSFCNRSSSMEISRGSRWCAAVLRDEAVDRQRVKPEEQQMTVDEGTLPGADRCQPNQPARQPAGRRRVARQVGARPAEGAMICPGLDPELYELLITRGGSALEEDGRGFRARRPALGRADAGGGQHPAAQAAHGGAHVVLGESLGSTSAAIHTRHSRYAMGIEINAATRGSITEGWVLGTCTALVLGRTLCTHEIVMTNEATGAAVDGADTTTACAPPDGRSWRGPPAGVVVSDPATAGAAQAS